MTISIFCLSIFKSSESCALLEQIEPVLYINDARDVHDNMSTADDISPTLPIGFINKLIGFTLGANVLIIRQSVFFLFMAVDIICFLVATNWKIVQTYSILIATKKCTYLLLNFNTFLTRVISRNSQYLFSKDRKHQKKKKRYCNSPTIPVKRSVQNRFTQRNVLLLL